jgi:hypothetical protein
VGDTLDNLRCFCRVHDNQIKEDSTGKRRRQGKHHVLGCDANGNRSTRRTGGMKKSLRADGPRAVQNQVSSFWRGGLRNEELDLAGVDPGAGALAEADGRITKAGVESCMEEIAQRSPEAERKGEIAINEMFDEMHPLNRSGWPWPCSNLRGGTEQVGRGF